MNRKRLSRLATAFLSVGLLGAMVAAAPVSAATPGWSIGPITKLPPVVADGGVAGFSFTITNTGKSNISALYLTDTYVGTPVYFTNNRGTSCTLSPDLRCAFGALVAGGTIDVVIAYTVGTTNFTDTFQLDSTGDPAGGNNSHGDSYLKSVTTNVSTNPNFDAGFVVDDLFYETTGSLGRGNKQTSSALVSDTHLTVTVEDGSGVVAPTTCTVACNGAFGEWTYLSVPGSTGVIRATLNIWGGAVPAGATANTIFLIHVLDSGAVERIGENGVRCASTPTPDCITVTKIGSNFRIVAYLSDNGNLRGGY